MTSPDPQTTLTRRLRAGEIGSVAGALADSTRRRILVSFLDQPGPRTVDDVAVSVGVHRTVAFTHLERLTGLGLLTKARRRGRVGKPAAVYEAPQATISLQYPIRQFAILAGLLAGGLRRLGAGGVEAARASGRSFGEGLAAEATRAVGAGARPATPAEALAPMRALGGDYALAGDRLRARGCLFLEACAEAPEIVCALHAGVIEGVLRQSGITATVDPAGSAVPGSCDYALRTVPAAPGDPLG